MCSALTLGLFSAFNRSSLSFCSYIMSDKEGEVDPKLISGGSFDDLRAYFDQKFSHLKRELSDDQVKSSSSLVKKLKSETTLTLSLAGIRSNLSSTTRPWNRLRRVFPLWIH